MDYKASVRGDVLEIMVGSSVSAKNYEALQEAIIAEIEAASPKHVVMNLGETTYISSAGLRTFSTVNKVCKEAGATWELAEASPQTAQRFKLTGYVSTLTIREKNAE